MKKTKRGTRRAGLVTAALFGVSIVGCGGGDEGTQVEQPVPTTVEISPESATLTFIDATQGFTAVVRDQNGRAMQNTTVSWSSSDAAVFAVSGNGSSATVTAAANGTGTLTATSGQASGTASVEVAQTPAKLEMLSGDEQEAVRGTALAEPLVVRIEDQGGTAIEGVPVTFLPDEGHGSVSETLVETAADGTASTEWTLGIDYRMQSLVAFSGDATARFSATAKADPPIPDLEFATVILSREEATVLETLDVTAEVVNLGDGATPGPFDLAVSVDGQIVETLEIDQLESDASTTVEFALGPFAVGRRTIELMLDPDGELEEWDPDNNSASRLVFVVDQKVLSVGEPATVSSNIVREVLLFRIDVDEASNEALNIVLSGGSGDADLFVHYGDRPGHTDDYRCNSGNIDTNESCQMVPTRVGTYHVGVLAFSAFGPSTLEATVGGRPVEAFDLELVFLNNGTSSQDDIVREAAEHWESVMGRGVNDFTFFTQTPLPANQCFSGQPGVSEEIDDIKVWVSIDSIDGVGGAVGVAGPCHVRSISYGFGAIVSTPTVGALILDEADVSQLESRGLLLSVVTHEIAHVLGFGTIWDIREWLRDPSLPRSPDADTHFIGPVTIPAFDAVGGGGYAGARVPVENGAEQGSADTHWRESVFGDELMTPYLTGDTQPLSLVTVESMYDIWYEVDLTAADAFSLSSAGRAGMATPRGPFIDLSNDVADWPIVVGDQKTGRVVKVIRPRSGR